MSNDNIDFVSLSGMMGMRVAFRISELNAIELGVRRTNKIEDEGIIIIHLKNKKTLEALRTTENYLILEKATNTAL